MLEEIDPDLIKEEGISMVDSWEEHWMDVSEDGEYKSNIYALRWNVYTKDKYELIRGEFLVAVPYSKGGNIVWTCVKDNIIG